MLGGEKRNANFISFQPPIQLFRKTVCEAFLFEVLKYSFSGLQSEEKPSKGSTPYGNYPVESEVEEKDEKDEEKEVDDSMYETEEESTPETESDQDSD